MKTATKVKDLDGFTGKAALYKLSKPLRDYEYVIASAATVLEVDETYLFGSDETGKILSWSALPGSSRGIYNLEVALSDAGYEVREKSNSQIELEIKQLQDDIEVVKAARAILIADTWTCHPSVEMYIRYNEAKIRNMRKAIAE